MTNVSLEIISNYSDYTHLSGCFVEQPLLNEVPYSCTKQAKEDYKGQLHEFHVEIMSSLCDHMPHQS